MNFVDTLADVYCRMEGCAQFDKSRMYLEQCAIFRGLPDPIYCLGGVLCS